MLPSFNFTVYGYQLTSDYLVNLQVKILIRIKYYFYDFLQIENYLNNETLKIEKAFDLLEDIPNERSDFSINSIFILSRNWEFTKMQPHLISQTPAIFTNLLFYVKKNNSSSEKMKLISLQENEQDDIPENIVSHSPKLVGKLEKFQMETQKNKCLNLGNIEKDELEIYARDLVHFANEDNFLLYSKYWFYEFEFFHPELMSLAVFWKFKKPNGRYI